MNHHLLVQGGLLTAEQLRHGTSRHLAHSTHCPPAQTKPQHRLLALFTYLAVFKRRQQPGR